MILAREIHKTLWTLDNLAVPKTSVVIANLILSYFVGGRKANVFKMTQEQDLHS
jgi:hypothetical protein